MTTRRYSKNASLEEEILTEEVIEAEDTALQVEKPTLPPPLARKEPAVVAPTGVVFITDEDRRIIKKYTASIMKKLGITKNRSYKV